MVRLASSSKGGSNLLPDAGNSKVVRKPLTSEQLVEDAEKALTEVFGHKKFKTPLQKKATAAILRSKVVRFS